MLRIQLLSYLFECCMLFALFIRHKIPIVEVRRLKRPRAEYVPVLGSKPSIPNQPVEVPEGSGKERIQAIERGALDLTRWRTRCGRVHGHVLGQSVG